MRDVHKIETSVFITYQHCFSHGSGQNGVDHTPPSKRRRSSEQNFTGNSERQIRELQQAKEELQREKAEHEEQIQKLREDNQHLRLKLREKYQVSKQLMEGKLCPRWGTWKLAPMIRGSATVSGSMTYFRPGHSRYVQSYNAETEELSTLPVCPTEYFTLAVVNGLLTAVGGWQSPWFGPNKSTNTLLSLITQKGGRREWVEHFPRMPTKRDLTAVVCSEKALVVAGGVQEGGTKLTTVEVMDTDTRKWSTASSLPHGLYAATATICENRVYLVGGYGEHGWTTSVLTCSLGDLLRSQCSQAVWGMITDLPVTCSSCVTLNRQLVAVGGQDSDKNVTNTIYSYNTENKSWEVISHMPTSRCWCLATVLPHNELMVMGGWTGTEETATVETAQF